MTRDQAAGRVLYRIVAREGGIGDCGDGKGTTSWGQTKAWLDSFGFQAPIDAHYAVQNYRTWLVRTRLIEVCEYPDSLADNVVDWAVNSGHPIAVRHLQTAIGVRGDGIIGPETIAAIARCDRPQAARRVLAARLRFLGSIVHNHPAEHARYMKAWSDRLAGLIELMD